MNLLTFATPVYPVRPGIVPLITGMMGPHYSAVSSHKKNRQEKWFESSWVGEAALNKRAKMEYTWPVQQGVFTDFTLMEHVWRHIYYNEFRVEPEGNRFSSRMHEEHNYNLLPPPYLHWLVKVPSLCMSTEAPLTLIAAGKVWPSRFMLFGCIWGWDTSSLHPHTSSPPPLSHNHIL